MTVAELSSATCTRTTSSLDGNGRLTLIDFEVATRAEDKARSALAHPGYAALPDRQGVDVDRYALACGALGVFAPQATILLNLHPGKAFQLADMITESPVPRATNDGCRGQDHLPAADGRGRAGSASRRWPGWSAGCSNRPAAGCCWATYRLVELTTERAGGDAGADPAGGVRLQRDRCWTT